MAAAATGEKIVLNFAWIGPNTWHGGSSNDGLDVRVVDLVFKDAKTKISVNIPKNISPVAAQKLPFTCRRYHKTEQETHPDSLSVTIEQIHNLTVRASFFEKGSPIGPMTMYTSTGKITQQQTLLRSDRDVRLNMPKELEIGQTYSLVISSDDLSLSARLIKEEASRVMEDKKEAGTNEFQERMRKMGGALIAEGMRNLERSSKGGDSSSTTADLVAHGMRGVIRAGQEIVPEIKVPNTKPSESPSDLDKLSSAELQSRFEATFRKDKELESQRMRAALSGNIEEMNRILQTEHANSQLLVNLGEALEKKGISPQIPQTESFQSAAREAAELQDDAIKRLQDECKLQ